MPEARYVDAVTSRGLASLDLPSTYPLDGRGRRIPHERCRPIGATAWTAGEPGIACRSAAPGAPAGGEELALFDRGVRLKRGRRHRFDRWYRGADRACRIRRWARLTIEPMVAVFGVLAGILQLVAGLPYIRDILRGSTTPQRSTWTIWTTLSFVVLASQWASGATWSLALTIGQVLSCGAIFVLALRRGVGGVSTIEIALLGIAALGIAGWQIADDPVVATCSVVVADLIGVALMLPKTYREPVVGDGLDLAIGVVSTLCALVTSPTPRSGSTRSTS